MGGALRHREGVLLRLNERDRVTARDRVVARWHCCCTLALLLHVDVAVARRLLPVYRQHTMPQLATAAHHRSSTSRRRHAVFRQPAIIARYSFIHGLTI